MKAQEVFSLNPQASQSQVLPPGTGGTWRAEGAWSQEKCCLRAVWAAWAVGGGWEASCEPPAVTPDRVTSRASSSPPGSWQVIRSSPLYPKRKNAV